MVALAWPLTRLVSNFGQTASQGQAPIAHTLAAFGPGLIGYGIAFVMLRVMFVLGEVRDASLRMVASAVAGVAVMAVLSQVMSDNDRAAALAIGYGASQVVGAVLLSVRVHRLTRSMSPSRSAGLMLEALIAGGAACGAMWLVEDLLRASDPEPALGFVLGGLAGVATFTLMMVLARGRDLWSWVRWPRPAAERDGWPSSAGSVPQRGR
jgi:putative peptidoglycan lipid II flippase